MLDFVLGIVGTLLYPLFSVVFLAIDGIQILFYAFAGIGNISFGQTADFQANIPITAENNGNIDDTGIVYFLMQHTLVKNLLISIMALALVLIVVFTVMAFLKNMYAAKPKGWKDIIGSAIKGLANFIFIPVCCLLGVWLGNILLVAINGATSGLSGGTQMSRKLFIAAAYNANIYRNANGDVEEAKQNIEGFLKVYDLEGVFGEIKEGESAEYYATIVDMIYSYGGSAYGNFASPCVPLYSHTSVGPGVTPGAGYYNLYQINYLILVVGGIFMLYALGSLTFAMIRRMFIILILFVLSPGLCAMYPLDDGKAVGQYVGEMKKQILSAYGAVAGLNIFFALLPLFDQISVYGSFWGFLLDDIVQLFIMVVGLLCVKEFISMISNFVGGEDAFSKGSGLMKTSIQKVGKTITNTSSVFARAVGTKQGHGSFFGSLAKQGGAGALKMLGIDAKKIKDAKKEGEEHALDGRQARSSADNKNTKEADILTQINDLLKDKLNSKGKMVKMENGKEVDMSKDEQVETLQNLVPGLMQAFNGNDKMQTMAMEVLADKINAVYGSKGRTKVETADGLKQGYTDKVEQRQKELDAAEKSDALAEVYERYNKYSKERDDFMNKKENASMFEKDADGKFTGKLNVSKMSAGDLEALRLNAEKSGNSNDIQKYQDALNMNAKIDEYNKLTENADKFKDKVEEAAKALSTAMSDAAKKFKDAAGTTIKTDLQSFASTLKTAYEESVKGDDPKALVNELAKVIGKKDDGTDKLLVEAIKDIKNALIDNGKK